MSQAFGTGANVIAYLGVAGTASQTSYNFLRNFANAPTELQAFLDEYETAQTAIEAFYNTLSQVRIVGLFVSHDAFAALNLAKITVEDVNLFVKGLRNKGDTNLGIWKKLEVAIKEQELARYSARLRNMTTHIIAVHQSINCSFHLKHSGQIAELRTHTATAETVSSLSAEVIKIRQAISDLKTQSATKEQVVVTKNDLMERITDVSSEIKLMLDLGRFSMVNDGIASLRDEVAAISSAMSIIAGQVESLNQDPRDFRSESFVPSAIVAMLDRLETLGADMTVLRSTTLDRLSFMQEKLDRLARQMREQDRRLYVIDNASSGKEVNSCPGDYCNEPIPSPENNIDSQVRGLIVANDGFHTQGLGNTTSTLKIDEAEVEDEHGSAITAPHSSDTESIQLLPHQHDLDLRDRDKDEETTGLDLIDPASGFKDLASRSRRGSDASDGSLASSCSNIESIFSSASSISSKSSNNELAHSSEELVRLLVQDSELEPLFQQALQKFQPRRFERNLSRLLKSFAFNLREECNNALTTAAANFVRRRARNIAHLICNRSNANIDAEETGRQKNVALLEAWFVGVASVDTSDNSSSEEDSDTSDDDLVPFAFRQLQRFIVESKALEMFRQNLRNFLSPGLQSGLETETTNMKELKELSIPSLQLEQPLSTAGTTKFCASPAPIRKTSKYESGTTALPPEPHFRASVSPSQSSQHDLDHDHDRERSNMAASDSRHSLLAIADCVRTNFGFLLPAVVGMMLGYYLHRTLREEKPRDLIDHTTWTITVLPSESRFT